ncbi:MAG: hypothetical protein COV52_00885 [Gammaproteobacteria bacterium CG11_big_fil_rev_8_21_14_0_20_46_22]|nr:MAG: hypothetical protein COV52_00885 [Gammaproteobacteria bacterium CG11_big_fil_rev_8_21_14_0_20_46_22]
MLLSKELKKPVKNPVKKTKIIFPHLLVCLLFMLLDHSSLAESEQTLNQALVKLVQSERNHYKLPALSVSILLPGERLPRHYVSGYYTKKMKQKITPNTLFQVGSITKTFAATMVLKLVEEHKLNINDKLGRWFPEYPKWKDVTVKELLTHTSGVYKVIDTKNFWQHLKVNPKQYWSLQELANLAYLYPDYFKAGQGYNYANTDYILLGMIIEKVTHQPISQVFREYLLSLEKFGLKNTYYTASGYPKTVISRVAHGYDDEGTFGYGVDVTNVSTSFSGSAGAIVSTPDDIILFLKQLFAGKILSAHLLKLMQTLTSEKTGQPISIQQALINHQNTKESWFDLGEGMGMGLVYFKDYGFVWMHAGGMPGYQSAYTYNPCKGIYVVLMYNKQPKENLVFVKITQAIVKTLDSSDLVNSKIKHYQAMNALSWFCNKE